MFSRKHFQHFGCFFGYKILVKLRATASALAKYKKCIIFHILTEKNVYISQCKSVQICTTTIVNVYICTVIVAFAFNILVFVSLSSLYL